MATFTITNLSSSPVYLGDFYASVPVGGSLVLTDRDPLERPKSLIEAMADGTVGFSIAYTADEIAAGLNVSADAHAARHLLAGGDEVDGDRVDIDFTPTNYTPDSTTPTAGNVDHLAAHLKGIDDALIGLPAGHAARHLRAGADEIDGDRLDIDLIPVGYGRDAAEPLGGHVEHLAAHLRGIDRRLVCSATHLAPISHTALLPSFDATTDIAVYKVDLSAGDILVNGILAKLAALTGQILIGAGAWTKSYDHAGAPAVVLSADGTEYYCTLVAMLVAGTVELHAVFSPEAASGAAVLSTPEEIATALDAAGVNGSGTVVAQFLIERVVVNTIDPYTVVDPATDATLAGYRAFGCLYNV